MVCVHLVCFILFVYFDWYIVGYGGIKFEGEMLRGKREGERDEKVKLTWQKKV